MLFSIISLALFASCVSQPFLRERNLKDEDNMMPKVKHQKYDVTTKNVFEKCPVDMTLSLSIDIKLNEKLHVPTREEVIDELYEKKLLYNDPVLKKFIAAKGVKTDLVPGSPQRFDFWKKLIKKLKPKIIVECGVFKGYNSIHLAKELVKQGLEKSFVISIDPWLFDQKFPWLKPLKKKFDFLFETQVEVAGGSQAYLQFMQNVIASGQSVMDHIVPIQAAGQMGAQTFMTHKWSTDIAYIDGSHNVHDVLMDISFWWPVISCDGALVGDDLDQPAVMDAFKAFTKKQNLKWKISENYGAVIIKRCDENGKVYTKDEDYAEF